MIHAIVVVLHNILLYFVSSMEKQMVLSNFKIGTRLYLAFGADKVCRVTSTALLRLSDGPAGDPLQIFDAHRLLIAQRAFAYLSRDLLRNTVVLRALDF